MVRDENSIIMSVGCIFKATFYITLFGIFCVILYYTFSIANTVVFGMTLSITIFLILFSITVIVLEITETYWTRTRNVIVSSIQRQTSLPTYEDVIKQQNDELEEVPPPSYYDAIVLRVI